MDRRNFLKQATGYALAVAGTMTGIGQVFASTMPAKENKSNEPSGHLKKDKDMEHRNLGGMEVSAIGLGCLPMVGYYGGKYEKKDMIALIRRAYDQGVTLFDTAEVYGDVVFFPGHNELLVGKAVAPFRKDIVLATKMFLDESEIADGTSIYDATRKHLEQSMKNLQTDYVDLYYLHRVNEHVSFEKIAAAMGRLIEEGVIRAWGMSQVDVDTLAKAHAVTPVAAVQNLYSMLERDCEKEIFPYCLEHNIGVVPFSPIASGFLSGKIKADTQFEAVDDVRKFVPQLSKENIIANQPVLDILAEFSAKKHATNAQISLAWMLHKYPNVVPIPGSKNQERILENLGAANVELTDDEFRKLETALNACTVYGHRGHVETEQVDFGKNWEDEKKGQNKENKQ